MRFQLREDRGSRPPVASGRRGLHRERTARTQLQPRRHQARLALAEPEPLTAIVDAVATQSAKVGGTVELVVAVKNTGPAIPHLALVFRTPDRWYERHEMTDLGGCTIAEDASGFDCGDLPANESKTYSFRGIASVWDETVS